MQILVQTKTKTIFGEIIDNDKSFYLEVEPSDTIANVKAKIRDQEDIDCSNLTYNCARSGHSYLWLLRNGSHVTVTATSVS